MKRIVLCFDGTWEGRASLRARVGPYPTNVEKTQIAVSKTDDNGNPQITVYYPGIGANTPSRLMKSLSGATGYGISRTICDAYGFLVDNFEIGKDELFIFGFSRGAYTARSLSGFMHWLKVIDKKDLRLLPYYYSQYRLPEHERNPETQQGELKKIQKGWGEQSIPILFLGVWDTVGSLGVPIPGVGRLFNRRSTVGFHNVDLCENVSHAYHALAIHELRVNFAPSLWSKITRAGQIVEQAWFPGTHSDVGGGNKHSGLSDVTLEWMLCKAQALRLKVDVAKDVKPDCHDVVFNSSSGVWRATKKRLRTFGGSLNECLHASLGQRLQKAAASAAKLGWRQRLQRSLSRRVRLWQSAEQLSQKLASCLACPDSDVHLSPGDTSSRSLSRDEVKRRQEQLKKLAEAKPFKLK